MDFVKSLRSRKAELTAEDVDFLSHFEDLASPDLGSLSPKRLAECVSKLAELGRILILDRLIYLQVKKFSKISIEPRVAHYQASLEIPSIMHRFIPSTGRMEYITIISQKHSLLVPLMLTRPELLYFDPTDGKIHARSELTVELRSFVLSLDYDKVDADMQELIRNIKWQITNERLDLERQHLVEATISPIMQFLNVRTGDRSPQATALSFGSKARQAYVELRNEVIETKKTGEIGDDGMSRIQRVYSDFILSAQSELEEDDHFYAAFDRFQTTVVRNVRAKKLHERPEYHQVVKALEDLYKPHSHITDLAKEAFGAMYPPQSIVFKRSACETPDPAKATATRKSGVRRRGKKKGARAKHSGSGGGSGAAPAAGAGAERAVPAPPVERAAPVTHQNIPQARILSLLDTLRGGDPLPFVEIHPRVSEWMERRGEASERTFKNKSLTEEIAHFVNTPYVLREERGGDRIQQYIIGERGGNYGVFEIVWNPDRGILFHFAFKDMELSHLKDLARGEIPERVTAPVPAEAAAAERETLIRCKGFEADTNFWIDAFETVHISNGSFAIKLFKPNTSPFRRGAGK